MLLNYINSFYYIDCIYTLRTLNKEGVDTENENLLNANVNLENRFF